MIVYQVNCQVDTAIAEKWEQYFKDVHLDDVISTGCFYGYSFRKEVNTEDRVLYSSEYYTTSAELLKKYDREFAQELRQEVVEKFNGHFTASRKVFEIIVEYPG